MGKPTESKTLTVLYVIFGASIRDLSNLGESPQEIMEGARTAIDQIGRDDPEMAEAGRVFVEAIARQMRP